MSSEAGFDINWFGAGGSGAGWVDDDAGGPGPGTGPNGADLPPALEREAPTPAAPSWEVRWTAEKGFGCFASQDIAAGETIISEAPMLTATGSSTRRQGLLDDCLRNFENLNEDQQRKYLSLHCYQHPVDSPNARRYLKVTRPGLSDEEYTRLLKIHRIFASNCFYVSESVTEAGNVLETNGLFRQVSRINHSCDPNCWYECEGTGGLFVLRANRDIAKGGELSLSYISNCRPRARRRRSLRKNWVFDCACEWCVLNEDPVLQDGNSYNNTLAGACAAQNLFAAETRINSNEDDVWGVSMIEEDPDEDGDSAAIGRRHDRRIDLLTALNWGPQLAFAYLDASTWYNLYGQRAYDWAVDAEDPMVTRAALAALTVSPMVTRAALAALTVSVDYAQRAIARARTVWGDGDMITLNAQSQLTSSEFQLRRLTAQATGLLPPESEEDEPAFA
ncbi:Uu.00g116360.m01.CDS01 [Anthostomella pinea]|uniref:Uu.00g116360.m01.CDS01 n=1 Tax=Anthostomella pinea TaxID=933095 RepID=A0AAI8VG28_9PEZI|nr:Uu.00g116360.m01.CDS01 [Anthostomella pinea]